MNYKRFGERVQKLRKDRGFSMGDLAERVGFSIRSIALVENGQADVNLSLLVQICTVLDITPNQILAGEYSVSDMSDALNVLKAEKIEIEQVLEKSSVQTKDKVVLKNELDQMIRNMKSLNSK